MNFNKRLSYYFFGLFIGIGIVYFINSQKKTEFNYLPTKRVLGDFKKKTIFYDNTFTDFSKENLLNDIDIDFSKSTTNKDSCNLYHIIKKNKYQFIAKNCRSKVYFSNLISTN